MSVRGPGRVPSAWCPRSITNLSYLCGSATPCQGIAPGWVQPAPEKVARLVHEPPGPATAVAPGEGPEGRAGSRRTQVLETVTPLRSPHVVGTAGGRDRLVHPVEVDGVVHVALGVQLAEARDERQSRDARWRRRKVHAGRRDRRTVHARDLREVDRDPDRGAAVGHRPIDTDLAGDAAVDGAELRPATAHHPPEPGSPGGDA